MARALDLCTVVDDGWDVEEPQALPLPLPPPPAPPTPSASPAPPVPPTPARALAADEPAQGKRRRFARGTDPVGMLKHHGMRRIVAQPGQFTDSRPLPGVPPLPTQSSVVASKVLATFPSDSEPARLARMVLANPEPPKNAANTIEPRKPPRKDPTPRARMASAALHRFGAVCYIGSGTKAAPAKAKPTHAHIASKAQVMPTPIDPASVSLKRPLWKRLFG